MVLAKKKIIEKKKGIKFSSIHTGSVIQREMMKNISHDFEQSQDPHHWRNSSPKRIFCSREAFNREHAIPLRGNLGRING